MTNLLSTLFIVDSRLGLLRTSRSNPFSEQERDFAGGFRETTDDRWAQAVTGRDKWREQANVLGRDVIPQQAPFRRKHLAATASMTRI